MSYDQVYAQVQAIAKSQGRSQTVLMSDGSVQPISEAIDRHGYSDSDVRIPGLQPKPAEGW